MDIRIKKCSICKTEARNDTQKKEFENYASIILGFYDINSSGFKWATDNDKNFYLKH